MSATPDLQRIRVIVRGAVQGVGFRPFVFRLAQELDLTGYVNNFPAGVCVEAEAPKARLEEFLRRLHEICLGQVVAARLWKGYGYTHSSS